MTNWSFCNLREVCYGAYVLVLLLLFVKGDNASLLKYNRFKKGDKRIWQFSSFLLYTVPLKQTVYYHKNIWKSEE